MRVHAQINLNDTIAIKEVVIKENRLAGGRVEQIDTLAIKTNLNASLADVLSEHSTIFIKSAGKGSVATASMRGAGASHTKVLWDNIPINSPMTGQVDFSILPVYFTDEINLQYGSASLASTGGALGGSVLLSTRPDWRKGWNGKVVAGSGSFNSYTGFAQLKWANQKIMARARGFYDYSKNNFKYYNSTYPAKEQVYERQENAAYWNSGVMTDVAWRTSARSVLDLNYWYQQSSRNLPKLMNNAALNHAEVQEDENQRLRLAYKWYGHKIKVEASTGYNLGFLSYRLKNKPLGYTDYITNIASESLTISSVTQFLVNKSWNNNFSMKAKLSVANHFAETNDDKSGLGYRASQWENALQLTLDKRIGKKWLVTGVIRQELINQEFIPIIPSAGLEYLLWSTSNTFNLSLKTNVARNYHHPTLNDKFFIPGGNPNLKPEQGVSAEWGLNAEYIKQKVSLTGEINSFYSVIDDWILWYPSQFGYWTPNNVQKVHSRGIECKGKGQIQWGKAKWLMGGKYAFTATTNESENLSEENRAKGEQLIYIPRHNSSVSSSLHYNHFQFNIMVHYTGERTTSTVVDEYNLPLGDFWLTNVSIAKTFKLPKGQSMSAQFKINNIFNIDYQSVQYRAMPGINYFLLINFEF